MGGRARHAELICVERVYRVSLSVDPPCVPVQGCVTAAFQSTMLAAPAVGIATDNALAGPGGAASLDPADLGRTTLTVVGGDARRHAAVRTRRSERSR